MDAYGNARSTVNGSASNAFEVEAGSRERDAPQDRPQDRRLSHYLTIFLSLLACLMVFILFETKGSAEGASARASSLTVRVSSLEETLRRQEHEARRELEEFRARAETAERELWQLSIKCGVHLPNTTTPASLPDDTPDTPSAAVCDPSGACCEQMDLIIGAGGGHHEGSWPEVNAACAKQSVSFPFPSFQPDSYEKCLESQSGMAAPKCLDCFGGAARYGFENCKMACMLNWCSANCLKCNAPYKATINECAGFDTPPATPCDGDNDGTK